MNATVPEGSNDRSSEGHKRTSQFMSLKTEHLLHMVLANVEDLIAVIDRNGKRLYNSPSYIKLFGEQDGLRGTDSFADIHPDDREMVRQVFSQTIESGVGKKIEYRFAVPGRPLHYIESQGNVVRGDDGNVTQLVIVSRDITTRKQIEQERTRLGMAVEQAAESTIITSTDGKIVYVNPAFEILTGYSKDEVIGENPRILKSGSQGIEFYQTLWATVLRGEVWSGELENRKKNGTLIRVETTISPVRDGNGDILNFVAVMRDVTYQRQMTAHMQDSQKMASLGQLAGGVAHNLNNIMFVLSGVVELLEPRMKDEQLAQYLPVWQDSIRRGIEIGKQLTVFGSAGDSQLVPVAPGDVIRSLSANLREFLEESIVIDTSIGPNLCLIRGDHALLYQSLLTLALNSRDAILSSPAADRTGVIRLSADSIEGSFVRYRFKDATAQRYVRVRVSDDGSGMGPEVQKHIFEPFFTTKPQHAGSGLGLAVVYGAMRAHHGLIDFDSESGKGTTFSLYFPAIPALREEPVVPETEFLRGESETVLLVEDDDNVRTMLERTLKSFGYSVLTATNGREGYDLFAQSHGQISAVVTDMGLPQESGFDMFLRIRELDPLAKVVFMSGHPDPMLRSKLSVAGATGFLTKPFEQKLLLAKLREVIEPVMPN